MFRQERKGLQREDLLTCPGTDRHAVGDGMAQVSAWAVYDIFESGSGEQVFVGVVSDGQWQTFCRHFGLDDLADDPELKENGSRVGKRDVILPRVQARFKEMDQKTLLAELEKCGVPFAHIGKPEDLFDDPHLNASGGLLDIELSDGGETRLPALPVQFGEDRLGLRRPVPKPGSDGLEVLRSLGLSDEQIQDLAREGAAEVDLGWAPALLWERIVSIV